MIAALTSSTALAHGGSGHHHHHRAERPAACAPAEIRIANPQDAWYDLYLDGEEVAAPRGFDDRVKVIRVPAGRHHLRVNDFMGDFWSRDTVRLSCGETLVAEIRDERGLRVLTRYGAERPAPPPRHAHGHTRPQQCTAGQLVVSPQGNAWYDVYLNGEKVVENRNFGKPEVLRNLQPGRHVVRVTDFLGRHIDQQVVHVGCRTRLHATVSESGMRLM
jgi:hypothetical protein